MLPETLLHYRILRPLGSGGMGDVYLAEDTKLGRRVALKVLPLGRTDDPERRQRFEREARAVAALNHPNIVTIHAVEHVDDITFLAMELVEGKTLSEIIPATGLPIDLFLKLAIPLASAVTAAHERGITHRDLKPANVMVGSDGRLKVLDFGLAKLEEVGDRSDATQTALKPEGLTGEGRIVGTVAYMSPEQAEGKTLDHRTDIFSLGVVLYEMATGQKPFKGDTTVSVLSSILRDAPPSVSDVNSAIPRDLGRIVKRALVKDPEHRYQTAKDVRNDLEALKEDVDSGSAAAAAMSASRPVAAALPGGRNTSIWIGAGALILVLAAGAVWLAMKDRAPVSPMFDNVKLTRLTNTGRVGLTAVSADGRYVVHSMFESGGKQSLWLRQIATNSNVQVVPPDTVRYDGLSFSPDANFIYYVVYPAAQNFSTVYQVPVLGGQPRKVIDDVDTPIAFSPDGKQIAFMRGFQRLGEMALVVAAADGTAERKVSVSKNPVSYLLNNVAWSPDGKTILAIRVASAAGKVSVMSVDVATGAEKEVGARPWNGVDSIAWMPDGRGFVAAAGEDAPDSGMQIWYVAYPGGSARRITNDLNSYAQVTVSSDAKTIVALQNEGTAHLWVASLSDPGTARQITTGTNRNDGASGLSWTKDGRIVYTSDAAGTNDLWITDAGGTNARQLTSDVAFDGLPLVTPDGKSVMFSSSRSGASVWIVDLDGGNARPLVTTPGAGWPLISPDSKWVYYTSFVAQQRQFWRMPLAGGAAERLTAHWEALGIKDEGIFYHPALVMTSLSPNGTLGTGFYPDPDRRGWRLGVFPMAGGTPTRLEILANEAAWTPDGKSLIYLDGRTGVINLFRQPISGGQPVQVTSYTTDAIWRFALSSDGKQLAMSRGNSTSDVVLIRAAEGK